MSKESKYLSKMNREAEMRPAWGKVIAIYVVNYLKRNGVQKNEIGARISAYPALLKIIK